MPSATVTGTLAYVYGVTWSDAAVPDGDGVAGGTVVPLEHGELTALVSAVEDAEIRARRRDLLSHADVVQRAFERATVVPLRFGTVFASRDDVVAGFLEPRYEELVQLLTQLDGLVELTVRAFYEEEPVLAEIVREEAEVAGLRNRADPGAQIRLGEAVAQALAARREADAGAILATLTPHARGSVVEERVAEFEVLRAAFLVERRSVGEVEAALEEAAAPRRDVLRVKLTGPLPPHHFVAERWDS